MLILFERTGNMEINYERLKKRFQSSYKRAKVLGIKPPTFDNFEQIVWESDGVCCYCNRALVWESNAPYKDVVSIDHKIPIALGGTNEITNLCVCCHACNIIKGTMSATTFQKLVDKLDSDSLRDEIFNEAFIGRKADKIEREGKIFGNLLAGMNFNLLRYNPEGDCFFLVSDCHSSSCEPKLEINDVSFFCIICKKLLLKIRKATI